MRDSSLRVDPGQVLMWILGAVVVVLVGIGLVWFGFEIGKRSRLAGVAEPPAADTPAAGISTPVPTSAAPVDLPTVTPLPADLPTITPLPGEMPTATPPAAATAALSPLVVVGSSGANLRSGPGTNYSRVGFLDPDAQATVTGRYGGWWQVTVQGSTAWISGEIVTTSNVESVLEVVPPPSPVPPAATAVPAPTQPSATQAPTNVRGLATQKYVVRGAPGPYGVGAEIWFDFTIANTTAAKVQYKALGSVVDETGFYQKSWSYSEFTPNQVLVWSDHFHIENPGTYHVSLAICFLDDECVRLMGPVEVVVQ